MKKVLAIALLALTLALVNCKDNSTADPEPAKTLNKSLMVNKYWVSSLTDHYFRSDGKYCAPDGIMEFGTWKWLNNSDSLEIVDGTGTDIWYVKYCTDNEMSAKPGKQGSYLIFTKK